MIPNEIEDDKNIEKKEFETFEDGQEKSEKLFFDHEEINEESNEENEILEIDEILNQKKQELENVQKEAITTINETQEKANKIMEDAKNKAESESNDIKAMAWEEGFLKGRTEAIEKMENDIDATFISANKILVEASLKAREIFMDNKKEMINLSMLMAKKIIKKELKNKEVLFNNLMEAMKKAQNSKELKIFVNWDQLAFGKELKEKLQNSFQGIEKIEIIEDRTVSEGGCIIETKLGKIDATIENQMEILFNSLTEE